MNKMNKTGLMTAVAIAVAAMAPQMATAADHHKAAVSAPTAQSALERRLAQMEQELAVLRAEVSKTRTETRAEVKATSAKVDAQEQKLRLNWPTKRGMKNPPRPVVLPWRFRLHDAPA